ncbi:PorT family protein [Parabacteroides sp. 52]|uniref:outer membrane beta-barrel protein n=1 Tax=unclassified Parabacteroides TaxID=2649774 RepID=UPI0013D41659|nr:MULTISPECIES: outer membrane beta-barrel protein [unclassified Parabacteroides]MDH6533716.1 hypothetical protein [Parabacteroides sp. PM5-20]NDV54468.1 PorT family protein [Parabacteroides sp. 52]
MKNKERDIVDDLIRSRLYDWEVDVSSADWEKIVDRLPAKALSIPFYRKSRFWAAAAVISLLLVMGGVYTLDNAPLPTPVAQEIQKQTEAILSRMEADKNQPEVPQTAVAVAGRTRMNLLKTTLHPDDQKPLSKTEEQKETDDQPLKGIEDERKYSKAASDDAQTRKDAAVESPLATDQHPTLLAAVTAVKEEKKEKPARKWGLGMGAGGMSVGTNTAVPGYVTNTMGLRSENLMLMNAASAGDELPKTNIKHKTPVSFGLLVSRYLDDRFSIQTGLTYSYLSSSWTTNNDYHTELQQSLHFIGIPLSLTYKIAEWNRFYFYASAGGQVEKNISGTLKTKLYAKGQEIDRMKEHKTMKEWLCSLNARAGVSYPVIRFVSAFAEVGAGYYFDNGSKMETIHSEKPFNVNLQFGLRFGF